MLHYTYWQQTQIRHMRAALSLDHSLHQDEQKDVIVLETEIYTFDIFNMCLLHADA